MGCDIHLHIELKINNKWEHFANPDINRWYELFAKMADVRNDDNRIIPISKPKGLPEDLSVITKIDWNKWGCDAHHVSWFNLDEIGELSEWLAEKGKKENDFLKYDLEYKILKTYFFGNSFYGFKKYPEDSSHLRDDGIQDIRFVFWFDN